MKNQQLIFEKNSFLEKELAKKNRELEIEASLERIRTRAIAMRTSEEINALIGLIFNECVRLGIHANRTILMTFDKETGDARWWMANPEVPGTPMNFVVKNHNFLPAQAHLDAWKKRIEKWIYPLEGENKAKWDQYIFTETELSKLPQSVKTGMQSVKNIIINASFQNYGGIVLPTFEQLDDESFDLLVKISKVFDLTYTRFLDLQKAEAQAREAQIEAALETVRSRSMMMHTSKELKEVAKEMRNQFSLLGQKELETCAIHLWNEASHQLEAWAALRNPDNTGEIIESETRLDIKGIRILEEAFQKYIAGKKDYVIISANEKAKEFFSALKKTAPQAYEFLSGRTKNIKPDDITAYWSISDFHGGSLVMVTMNQPDDNSRALLRRFANVFGQAYQRFKDLQKAEAQARESQIQLALERVRARTMAMQKQDDLLMVLDLLVEQLVKLGVNVQVANFSNGIPGRDWDLWIEVVADANNIFNNYVHFPRIDHPYFHRVDKNIETYQKHGTDLFKDMFSKEEKDSWQEYIHTQTIYKDLTPEEVKQSLYETPGYNWSMVILKDTWVSICRFDTMPFSDEEDALLRRFASAFGQAYTRFLDLQKAEAQAREAQIEAALERVRGCSLAMHKSDELKDVVAILFEKLKEIGLEFDGGAAIHIFKEGTQNAEILVAAPGLATTIVNNLPYDKEEFINNPIINDIWSAKETGCDIFNKYYPFEEKNKYFKYVFKHNDNTIIPDREREFILNAESYTATFIAEKNSLLGATSWTKQQFSKEDFVILKRFAKVFEQAYIRFLDLQKAEAQAREAQIEAALEKVRSRSMAMQKAGELKEVIRLVLEQFVHLKINAQHAGFYIDYKAQDDMHIWLADPNLEPFFAVIPYFDTPTWNSFREAKAKGTTFHTDLLDFEEKNKFYNALFELFTVPDEAKQFYLQCKGLAVSTVLLDSVGLYIENFEAIPYSEEENKVLLRFGKVFQQTYTRFLDLQKAEAQAREAQIEAALERVRAKTMAMQKSEELLPTAEIMFDQLKLLGAELQGVAFAICDKDNMMVHKWTSIGNFSHPYDIEPGEQRMYEAWENQSAMYEEVYEGEKQKKYYEKFMEIPDFRKGLQKIIDLGIPIPTWQKNYAVPFKNGYVLFIITKPFEETQIFVRFGKVFEQTYTRFLDLQKAEAAAREAIKQAALDRIRANIAAMRTVDDLDRITPLIWNELTVLGIPFIRCGVFIMDDEQQLIHTFLSTPDGKAITAFHIPYHMPGNIGQIINHWRNNEKYIDHWDENAFTTFAQTLVEQGALASPEKYFESLPHGGFYLHFVPFLQGMLYVGNINQLSEEEINLIQSLANAFSTAYARYEDFNKLEAAKKQVDAALNELQATQKQLIQSEKMASLGELTAGIAHEIQNPLNFVNNFSEVNKEMLEEMKAERSKPNADRTLEDELINDLIDNSEKINHHGKRADAIVKGMLQHSRASTGKKEPTDINALADEYLRLSYHGLRAKDKSFNATIETDFDKSLSADKAGIGKINMIPQDIGRVLLNLFNNAFYACAERSRSAVNEPTLPVGRQKSNNLISYEPKVSVTTKKSENRVCITVRDNGNGIPQKIIDKIFQPFFTTKPAGEGTGLGLSLAYDIVKAHGGEIKVESKEGEGSAFDITLPI